MRKLASLRTIDAVLEHPNADRLSIYVVDGWKVIDAKERYQPGDVVVYCEIDSFLPVKNEFEFLRKSSFKRMGEQEGFRLRTIRLRGELSQGLLLPIDLLSADSTQLELGTDVSESLGIIKYERPIPPSLSGIAKGDFPGFIPKTDEERIQNLEYGDLKQYAYTVTEKLDGSSMTVFVNNGEIGVCSRNLELVEDANNTLWQMAAQYSLPEKLKTLGRNLAIQGELIGHKIQRNPYRLNAHDLRVFKVWDIDSH
ncbi:MAG: RNA ligase (ATP), partial [Bacteroidota bacterium]